MTAAATKSKNINVFRENVIKTIRKKKGKLLSSFGGAHDKILLKCIKGHRWKATANSIKQGTWCIRCHNEESKKNTINELQKNLKDFYLKNGRTPRRSEFNQFCGKNSGSAASMHFGSWTNFIKSQGLKPRGRQAGDVWFAWENLCLEIIKVLYPKIEIKRQYKYEDRKTVDFYLPQLGLAIDSKTSNYDTLSLKQQVKRYKINREFRRIEFWCLYKTNEKKQPGIKYRFKEDLISVLKKKKKNDSRKLLKMLSDEDLLRKRFGTITKEEMLDQIKLSIERLGRIPSKQEFDEMGDLHKAENARRLFGSWYSAIKAAGHTPKTSYVKIMGQKDLEQAFLTAINKYKSEFGRIPNLTEYQKFSVKNNFIWINTIRTHLKLKRYTDVLEYFDIKYDFSKIGPQIDIEKYLNKLCDINLEPLESFEGLYSKDNIRLRCYCCREIIRSQIGKINSLKGCTKCVNYFTIQSYKKSLKELQREAQNSKFLLISPYSDYRNSRSTLVYRCNVCKKENLYIVNSIKNGVACVSCKKRKED